jgi:uncharacterized protein (TIGR00369 family)
VRQDVAVTIDAADVRASLARQSFMTMLGAEPVEISRGRVVLELAYRKDLCQQNDFLHAGVIASIADSACGYAALTLMPPGSDVLSVEFKVNLMAPAVGERFRAVGSVVRSGRTLTVCSGEVLSLTEGSPDKQVALMQATMIALSPE